MVEGRLASGRHQWIATKITELYKCAQDASASESKHLPKRALRPLPKAGAPYLFLSGRVMEVRHEHLQYGNSQANS